MLSFPQSRSKYLSINDLVTNSPGVISNGVEEAGWKKGKAK